MTATMTAKKTESIDDQLIAEHREWLRVWYELNEIASSGFTPQGQQLPMTQEARDAAITLPDVLDRLEEIWVMMDPALRPAHYLMRV